MVNDYEHYINGEVMIHVTDFNLYFYKFMEIYVDVDVEQKIIEARYSPTPWAVGADFRDGYANCDVILNGRNISDSCYARIDANRPGWVEISIVSVFRELGASLEYVNDGYNIIYEGKQAFITYDYPLDKDDPTGYRGYDTLCFVDETDCIVKIIGFKKNAEKLGVTIEVDKENFVIYVNS